MESSKKYTHYDVKQEFTTNRDMHDLVDKAQH